MRETTITVALLLAACSQESQPPENQATATEKATAGTNVTGNLTGVTVNEANTASNEPAAGNGSASLPPASAALRFVGKWAKNQAECKTKPWVFTDKELTAVGGPHCSIYNVAKAPGGYNLAATCPAKEPVHTDLISVRFAESAQAMLVESNAISPLGLVYCGK